MGDPSYMASDLQSVLHTQKSITLKENHAGQNGTNIDDHHIVNKDEENLPELLSNEGGVPFSTKIPPQQNGYHAEMKEGETESGRLEPQTESEAAQVDMSNLDKNGSISSNSLEAREEDSNGDIVRDCNLLPANSHESMQDGSTEETNGDIVRDCNLLPANSHESMQDGSTEETNAQAPAKISHEGAVVDQDHTYTSDKSNDSLMGASTEDENAVSSYASDLNSKRGDEDDGSRKIVDDNENVEEIYSKEKKSGYGKEPERLDESFLGSATQPCISAENSLEDTKPPPVVQSANESRQHENEATNEPGEDLEVPSPTSNAHNAVREEGKLNEGEWPDQGHGVTMVISNDMEGWQHFDTEEVNTFMNQNQGSDQSLQPWERLLDDGLDGAVRENVNPPLQLAMAPFPFEENKFALASPGNPFMEGLGRVSSFSEADGFAQSRDLPSAGQLSHSLEGPSSFQWREGQIGGASGNDHVSSVFPTIDGETKAVRLESVHELGSNLDLQLPSAMKPLASFDAMEPFEAPSFMSLVDPKSHALFEASMPTFQASSTVYGQETGGEKWVANFDLMAPSTQEISRSLSMPRSGGEMSGSRAGQSFSFATNREHEGDSPQAQRTKSGFLSPKFSPIVQKVVDKVRTTPAVANGVINSVRQAVSPKVSETKPGSKSLLTRCMCW